MENQNYIQEDEIDLKELFTTIWKNKLKIILLTFIITVFAIIYALSKPNVYASSTLLTPSNPSKSMNLGGLGGLASLAGINVGGSSGGLDALNYMKIVLEDFDFNKKIIEKYKLEKILKVNKENLVFAMNNSTFYNLLNSEAKPGKNDDAQQFTTYKALQKILSLSQDKKSQVITLKAEHIDRFLVKKLVDIYLEEVTNYIKENESIRIKKQLEYYSNELKSTTELSLKEQLNKLISSLVQKKVLSNSSKFYIVKQITVPRVAYVKEKTKPKRALIVIVAFITSFILGIFLVFLLEFIKNDNEKEKTNV